MSSDLIKQIQAKYNASLKEKLITLETLWSDSKEKSKEKSKLNADGEFDLVLAFLHQFAGSAGMYGYNEISEQCVQLQALIRNAASSEDVHTAYEKLAHQIDQSINA